MATDKTIHDFLNEVSALNAEILEAELIARSILPQRGPVINKRRQLANALLVESQGSVFAPYFQYDPMVDLRKCTAFVTLYRNELEKQDKTAEQKRIALANLRMLDARISRILCTTNEEKAISKNLLSTVKQLILSDVTSTNDAGSVDGSDELNGEDQLANSQSQNQSSVILSAHTENVRDKSAQATIFSQFQPGSSNPRVQCNIPNPLFDIENGMSRLHVEQQHYNCGGFSPYNQESCNPKNKLPVYKWKIKFSGLNDKQDAFEFLRMVKSKAQSYQTSQTELFASASEFFTGEASKWYFSQHFADWSEIESKLLADFMQVNYFDDLIDIIRKRKQAANESIVQFFTVFEDNCSRLLTPLSTLEKINILKRNIFAKYQPYIALVQFKSIDEMKHALKILEATMSYSGNGSDNSFGRNVRFDSRDRHSHSPHRYSHSPHRSDTQPNYKRESKVDNVEDKDKDYRSSRDRTRSPYPSSNAPNKNENKSRERSNSNSSHTHSRNNSRDRNFRSRSQENVRK